jgi:hypothetical protein
LLHKAQWNSGAVLMAGTRFRGKASVIATLVRRLSFCDPVPGVHLFGDESEQK